MKHILLEVEQNKKYELTDGLTIGRVDGLTFPENPKISRTHLVFRIQKDGVLAEDLKSTNGTKVNGKKLKPGLPQALVDGDHIRIGHQEFIYKKEDDAPSPVKSSPKKIKPVHKAEKDRLLLIPIGILGAAFIVLFDARKADPYSVSVILSLVFSFFCFHFVYAVKKIPRELRVSSIKLTVLPYALMIAAYWLFCLNVYVSPGLSTLSKAYHHCPTPIINSFNAVLQPLYPADWKYRLLMRDERCRFRNLREWFSGRPEKICPNPSAGATPDCLRQVVRMMNIGAPFSPAVSRPLYEISLRQKNKLKGVRDFEEQIQQLDFELWILETLAEYDITRILPGISKEALSDELKSVAVSLGHTATIILFQMKNSLKRIEDDFSNTGDTTQNELLERSRRVQELSRRYAVLEERWDLELKNSSFDSRVPTQQDP